MILCITHKQGHTIKSNNKTHDTLNTLIIKFITYGLQTCSQLAQLSIRYEHKVKHKGYFFSMVAKISHPVFMLS